MELIISLDDRNFEYSAKQESKIGLFEGFKKTIENILEKKVFSYIQNRFENKINLCSTFLWFVNVMGITAGYSDSQYQP